MNPADDVSYGLSVLCINNPLGQDHTPIVSDEEQPRTDTTKNALIKTKRPEIPGRNGNRQGKLASLGHHIIHCVTHFFIGQVSVATTGRHAVEAMDGVVIEGRLALGDPWAPIGSTAEFW